MSLTSAEEPEMILVIHTDDEEKQITFTPYNENFLFWRWIQRGVPDW